MHDGTSGGHLGVNKPLDKIRKQFYWLHLRHDIEEWVRTCEICAASKGPQTRSRGKMRQYNVGLPFERIDVYKRQLLLFAIYYTRSLQTQILQKYLDGSSKIRGKRTCLFPLCHIVAASTNTSLATADYPVLEIFPKFIFKQIGEKNLKNCLTRLRSTKQKKESIMIK